MPAVFEVCFGGFILANGKLTVLSLSRKYFYKEVPSNRFGFYLEVYISRVTSMPNEIRNIILQTHALNAK